jgi:RecA-family ATPase
MTRWTAARDCGLTRQHGLDTIEHLIKSGVTGISVFTRRNGQRSTLRTAQGEIPLSVEDWLARDLPEPDFLMGSWLSTTSRAILNAATGLGKTNFLLTLLAHMADGADFLHWRARRPARGLFIDGEMSRRLLRQRVRDVVRRLGRQPAGLHILSHEDIPDFAPLNTAAGQNAINAIISTIGKLDFICFDNIMSLISGDHREDEGWRQTNDFRMSLTKREIGQVWAHHTGHDASHGYGTKVREWAMDVVIQLNEACGRWRRMNDERSPI